MNTEKANESERQLGGIEEEVPTTPGKHVAFGATEEVPAVAVEEVGGEAAADGAAGEAKKKAGTLQKLFSRKKVPAEKVAEVGGNWGAGWGLCFRGVGCCLFCLGLVRCWGSFCWCFRAVGLSFEVVDLRMPCAGKQHNQNLAVLKVRTIGLLSGLRVCSESLSGKQIVEINF